MDLVVFWYLYGGFDAWPINTEFLGDDWAIFRVGVFRSMAFHCKILNMPEADPGFQVRRGALKNILPSGGRRENFGGISCEKSRFYAKKSYFFQF